MPLLFSLEAVKGRMVEGVLLAFLDDVYIITTPERVGDVYMARTNSTDTPGFTVAKRRCGTQLETVLKHARIGAHRASGRP